VADRVRRVQRRLAVSSGGVQEKAAVGRPALTINRSERAKAAFSPGRESEREREKQECDGVGPFFCCNSVSCTKGVLTKTCGGGGGSGGTAVCAAASMLRGCQPNCALKSIEVTLYSGL
jgi:hypothetical protein